MNSNNKKTKIGIITEEVVNLLNLNKEIINSPILIGDTNIKHIKENHLLDYEKYKFEIKNIVNNPDYVALNPNTGSIEYIKEFVIDNEFVLVAARVTTNKNFYIRSLYVMNKNKIKCYKEKNYCKKI